MGDWSKLYETLTKPLPAVSALFLILASSILLFGPHRVAEVLGLTILVETYRWVPGILFLVGASWLVIIVAVPFVKWLHQRWVHHQQYKRLRARLAKMTQDESIIVNQYITTGTRCLWWSGPDIGTAQVLADDGILYRPNIDGYDGPGVPYSLVQKVFDLNNEQRERLSKATRKKK